MADPRACTASLLGAALRCERAGKPKLISGITGPFAAHGGSYREPSQPGKLTPNLLEACSPAKMFELPFHYLAHHPNSISFVNGLANALR